MSDYRVSAREQIERGALGEAIKTLERARGKAVNARDLDALRELLPLAVSVSAAQLGRRERDAAERLIYAIEQNVRYVERFVDPAEAAGVAEQHVPPALPPAEPSGSTATGASPSVCANCGSPLVDGARFCPSCGAAVQVAPTAPAAPPETASAPPMGARPPASAAPGRSTPVRPAATRRAQGWWQWYRHPWRTYRRLPWWGKVAVVVVIVVIVAVSAGGSKKSSPSPRTASNAASGITGRGLSPDEQNKRAEASVDETLRVIASDYQDFGSYALMNTFTLRNLDHRLRSVPTLTAHSQDKSFFVSVRSATGTVFAVSGKGFQLRRTCAPTGPGCTNGRWAGSSHLVLPKVPVVTAAEKAKVNQILSANVNHYARLLALGEQILGSTQYANATAGLAAFNDPNSAASRFRDYQTHQNPDADLSYLNAFRQADSYYTAANEPLAISTWRDDMGNVGADLDQWVTTAVGWQIRENSTTSLQNAERKVRASLATARRDITAVLAGR